MCRAVARQVARTHHARMMRTPPHERSYVRNIDECVVPRSAANTLPAPRWLVEATTARPRAGIIPSALAARL